MEHIGKLIVFKMASTNGRSTMNRFCRRFYGYVDHSCNYKYTYKRRGFLDDFPHLKLQRGVVVVRKQDAKEVITFLESSNAEIFARDIVLIDEDLVEMSQKIE